MQRDTGRFKGIQGGFRCGFWSINSMSNFQRLSSRTPKDRPAYRARSRKHRPTVGDRNVAEIRSGQSFRVRRRKNTRRRWPMNANAWNCRVCSWPTGSPEIIQRKGIVGGWRVITVCSCGDCSIINIHSKWGSWADHDDHGNYQRANTECRELLKNHQFGRFQAAKKESTELLDSWIFLAAKNFIKGGIEMAHKNRPERSVAKVKTKDKEKGCADGQYRIWGRNTARVKRLIVERALSDELADETKVLAANDASGVGKLLMIMTPKHYG